MGSGVTSPSDEASALQGFTGDPPTPAGAQQCPTQHPGEGGDAAGRTRPRGPTPGPGIEPDAVPPEDCDRCPSQTQTHNPSRSTRGQRELPSGTQPRFALEPQQLPAQRRGREKRGTTSPSPARVALVTPPLLCGHLGLLRVGETTCLTTTPTLLPPQEQVRGGVCHSPRHGLARADLRPPAHGRAGGPGLWRVRNHQLAASAGRSPWSRRQRRAAFGQATGPKVNARNALETHVYKTPPPRPPKSRSASGVTGPELPGARRAGGTYVRTQRRQSGTPSPGPRDSATRTGSPAS